MDRVHFYGFIMNHAHFYTYNVKFNKESNGMVKISLLSTYFGPTARFDQWAVFDLDL